MADLTVGKKAPLFTLPSDGGQDISLSDYKGGKVILYFYPKDNTSGCTLEAQAFRANLEEFKKRGYSVLGVSRDSVKKHCNFRDKYELNFPLLSDEKETVCNLYGVMKEKSMYGKKYMGMFRTTFIIDGNGIIERIISPKEVNTKEHGKQVVDPPALPKQVRDRL